MGKYLSPPRQLREKEKVDDFYAARSNTSPPLSWSSFAPPFSRSAQCVYAAQPVHPDDRLL